MTGGEHRYLLDNSQVEAGARLDALATLFDPSSFRHLEALGLQPGWRCWEVGAGGPTVANWLVQRVGPGGYVVATDIDITHLVAAEPSGFHAVRHELGADEAPPGPFDLVHARLVLVHIARREEALIEMVRALRPGGWLLVEEADPELQPLVCPDATGPEQRLANRLKDGFRTLMVQRGVDLAYGRTLPRRLRGAGLGDVGADASFPMSGPACTTLELTTVAQIREQLVTAGAATDDEIDRHLATVATGRLDLATSPMVTAWGRKPSVSSPAPAPVNS